MPQPYSIFGDALLDLERWNAEGVLSIYGQIQPTTTVETDSLEPLDGLPSALMVVDYRLSDRLKSATAKFEKRIVSKAPPGRLAVVVDGNSPDPDDIGATAVTLGLLSAAGLSDQLVHLSHSCDLEPVARISPADELRRQKLLQLVCSDGLARFGPFENLAGFFNCRTEQASAVVDLRDAINGSSENDPLWIIVAGEPDVIGYALQAASAPRHPHVHVVSHHPANDNSGDFFSWQQILDFGVTEHQIGDQNVGLQTRIEEWDWAKSHRNGSIRWIYEQLAIAERDRVVKFQKGKFDCSDAGMIHWWLTGADQGGNAHATPKDIAEVLQQATE